MLSSQTTCDVERSFEPDDTKVVGEPLTAYLEEARGAFSRNTERALRADVQVFTAWCRQHFREAFPASAATVVAFVDDMGRVKTPATVRRYVSSIATLHKALRQANPLDSASVRFALQRMHRLRGRRQAQVQGLTWPLRNRLLEAAGDRLIDVRNRALLAVGYDTLLRRSELVSLEVPDLLEEIDGTATLLVRSGKTDADGRGAMLYLARDTVQLVKTWLELGGVDGGRLFRSWYRWKCLIYWRKSTERQRCWCARARPTRTGEARCSIWRATPCSSSRRGSNSAASMEGGCSAPCARTPRSARDSTRARCRASTSEWLAGPGSPATSWTRWPGTARASGRFRT